MHPHCARTRINDHRSTVMAASSSTLAHHLPALLWILLAAFLLQLAIVTTALAQYPSFPRLGLSTAPDRYELDIAVHGDETFELHVLVLPPDGETLHEHQYRSFQWAVLEACCGGAAVILDEEYNPACQSEGDTLGGMVTEFDECVGGDVIHLATLTLQMAIDVPGVYWIIAGPLGLATACSEFGEYTVLMTDMLVNVHYTTDVTPAEGTSWTGVKNLFR